MTAVTVGTCLSSYQTFLSDVTALTRISAFMKIQISRPRKNVDHGGPIRKSKTSTPSLSSLDAISNTRIRNLQKRQTIDIGRGPAITSIYCLLKKITGGGDGI